MSATWKACAVPFCKARVYALDEHVAVLCPQHEATARKQVASKARRAAARGPRGKLKGIR